MRPPWQERGPAQSACAARYRPDLRAGSAAPKDVPKSRGGCSLRSLEEIADELRAVRCEYALGMKLDAFDGQRSVAHTHDFTLRGARSHLEHRRDAAGFGDQRVIPAGFEVLAHAGIQPLAIVRHGGNLAVHQAGRSEEHTSELQSHVNLVC